MQSSTKDCRYKIDQTVKLLVYYEREPFSKIIDGISILDVVIYAINKDKDEIIVVDSADYPHFLKRITAPYNEKRISSISNERQVKRLFISEAAVQYFLEDFSISN